MDPMTQSAQISSSQGFADGHNSGTKDSKISDSFLSSSPVSLIQSPQDKRVLGSGNNSELHFPQSTSSSPGNFSSQSEDQPDSPIKTSPVSERIKALEALAAKKKEPDFRSDGYSHYRDRHTDKRSSIEIQKAAFEKNEKTTPQKKGSSSDKESPDSPFEVLGECKQLKELEETEEWMKAHLPPMPDFNSDDITKGPAVSESIYSTQEKENVTPEASASFACVPDAFMDFPVKGENLEGAPVPQNPYAEEECDFDLSFLPTAYMWNQQEKNNDALVGFGSKSASVSSPEHSEKTRLTCNPDPPETVEVDSSGESDDTVIEDGIPVHAQASSEFERDACSNLHKDDKETSPAKSERKLMQVPTINVIETDEPNYSEEEMEFESEEVEEQNVKDQDINAPGPNTIPESQFTEGYSPPSSPVESDTEISPKHKKQEPSHEAAVQAPQEPQSPDDFRIQSKEFSSLPSNDPVEDFSDHDDEWGDQKMDVANPVNTTAGPASFTKPKMDETSKDITDAPLETHNLQTSFLHDDIFERESFDYDYDAPPSPTDDGNDSEPDVATDTPYTNPFHVNTEKNGTQSNARDSFTLQNDNTNQDTFSKRYPQDPYSIFYTAPKSTSEPAVDNGTQNMNLDDNCNKIKDQNSETQQSKDLTSVVKEDPCIDASTEPADSFVQFMRECLKSQGDDHSTSDKMDDHISQSVAMDLEQEKLTISALKELGGSQEGEVEPPLQSAKSITVEPSLVSTQHNTQSPCFSNTQPLSSPSNPPHDGTYAPEVEAIDEWVAEAYHLAEHVLTAILTHLSGNLFFSNSSPANHRNPCPDLACAIAECAGAAKGPRHHPTNTDTRLFKTPSCPTREGVLLQPAQLKDLIHWRDPKKSGVVFGVSMLMLLSLAAFSVISVISYLLLALLCVTITFRIYKSVVQAVQKSNDGHPFKSLIEKDVSIPPETFRKHVDASLSYINRALKQLSRLFLVEDLVDSLKLAVVMWLLTYVGAVFNGITILILADILLFAVPPIYEKNKTQIDQYIDLARTQINSTMAKLQEKLPGAMKRTKSE
ncbi:reticulon-3 [Periophthalmus magnuspinnatus]|uniref:reticulon-3 n=1 Tax=Periophthalmus magnuspinnatus TaxID=409849 RepID=UPI0024368E5A|nr:reticulon-3 [Periophthalmus magnuspinnatus]